ncbi:MAG: hypothetical protein ACPLN0_04695 [Candidatus Hydrothermia bacterium]
MKFFLVFLILSLNAGERSKSPTKAVLLSCFIPAGGQFYNEKFIKGTIIGGLEVYTGYRALESYLSYRKNGNTENFGRALSFGFYFLGTWLYSMADAYVDAHLYNFSRRIKFEATTGSVCLKYKFK